MNYIGLKVKVISTLDYIILFENKSSLNANISFYQYQITVEG